MGRPRKQPRIASSPIQIAAVPVQVLQNGLAEGMPTLQEDLSIGTLHGAAMNFDPASLMDPSLATYNTDLTFLDFLGTDFTAIPPLSEEAAFSGPVIDHSAWEAHDHDANIDPNLSLLTPPSREDSSPASHSPSAHTPAPLPCTCLSALCLAVESLADLPTTTLAALQTARTAARTVHNAIRCPACCPSVHPPPGTTGPTTVGVAAFQSMMLVGTLIPSLVDAYHKILQLVDDETARAVAARRLLTFSLSQYGGMWIKGAFCGGDAVYENKEMEPGAWRLSVRSLLKMDVYGISCRSSSRDGTWQQAGLNDLVAEMDAKSLARHAEIDALIEAGLPPPVGMAGASAQHSLLSTPHCRSVIANAREAVERLVIA